MLKRRVRLTRPRVVQHGVTMRERASLGVLARDPDRDALLEERGEGERLGMPPVDPAFAQRLASSLELALEASDVDLEAGGDVQELFAELEQALARDGRDHRCSRIRPRERLGSVEPATRTTAGARHEQT